MSSLNARRFPLRFLARLGALAGMAVGLSVCGSQDRLNTGGPTAPGTDATPPVVQIILPTDTLIEIADSLKFTVNATDNTRLKSAQVTVAGLGTFALAVSKDTTFAVTATVTMYTQAFVVPLPTNAAGQRIAISATATDGNDNVTTWADTVRVNDAQPPVVAMLSPAASVAVGSGDTIHVLARATDPSGVRYLGARLFVRDTVLGRVQTLAVDSLRYSSRQYMRLDSFRIVVPTSLAPGNYILQVFAADSSPFFNKGASPDLTVAVRDVSPPTGSFNGPALDSQVIAGDTLPISFHATDNVGVVSVKFRGYSLRANPNLGPPDTTVRFQSLTAQFPLHPADANPVVRRLMPVISAATADSALIEAILTDIGGNVTTLTRRIQVVAGIRAVTIQSPLLVDTAVSAGDSLLVQFRVQDRRGITGVVVEGLALRGDSQLGTDSLVPRFASRVVSLNSVRDTTLRRYLWSAATDLRAEPVFIRVRSTSTAGDTTTALHRIQVITGASARVASPSRDTTFAVGNPLAVTVSGYDPDSLAVVGYVSTGAIARRDSSVYVTPLGQARTAALSLPVPGTTPLATDTITPFVIDRLGNRTVGEPIVVTFQDLTPPTLAFVSPTIDTGIAYGAAVPVRVRVRDNAPGTAVSLVGRAVNAAGQTQTWFSAVSVAGLASLDTTVALSLPAIAVDPAGAVVYLVGTATDAVGNTFRDSIRVQVSSGPYVRITEPTTGTQIRLGQTGARILPLVQAYSPDTILYLGYVASGRITGTDSIATTRALTATTLAQQLALVVPYTTPLGTVTLTPFVRTRVGRIAGPAVSVELIDGSLPMVLIVVPTHAGTFQTAAGDSLFVRVAASDDRQLGSLKIEGFARRPDVWPDSLSQVTPVLRYVAKTIDLTGTVRDTVVRYLNAVPTDSSAENAYIVATATDLAGNVAVDTVKVIVMNNSGPVVSLVRPTGGSATSPGKRLVIEVHGRDGNGVRLLGWRASGAVTAQDSLFFSPRSGNLADSATFVDTLLVPPATPLGALTIEPFGVDSLGNPSALTVGATVTVQSAASDIVAPTVRFAVSRRVEVNDSISVTASDAGGIRRVGWVAKIVGPDTVVAMDSTQPDLPGVYSDVTGYFSLNLPATLHFPAQIAVQAFAVDSVGNRGVAVAETLTVVAGRTFALPGGSNIGDAIYNPNRGELYLSNTALDRIEVFDVATSSFVASIPVGSRPVGLVLWPSDTTTLANADTLIVANSGGTNLSIVDLVTRVERQRYRLPNYVIQKVKAQRDATTGFTRLTITEYDYSDRPQYVAAVCRYRPVGGRANCGDVVALYSTTPTPGQVGYPNRGYLAWENLTRTDPLNAAKGHFFWEQAASGLTLTTDTLQIIEVRDSVPGVPVRRNLLGAGVGQIVNFDLLQFQDSTFVRNSGNFLRALVGEGGANQGFARVMAFDPTPGVDTLYMAADTTACNAAGMVCVGGRDRGISDAVFVRDFIANRASGVSSIAINQNGRTMLVRADSIYAFNLTLGQTGLMRAGSGAVGMDFHPNNDFDANVRGTGGLGGTGSPSNRLVFAARPDSSIDVFDTFFYGQVTDNSVGGATIPVPIRNSLIGPVRAATRGGNTLLFGLTAYGLVQVQLPSITNSLFPTAGLRASAPAPASVPRIVSSGARRTSRDPSPPRE